LRLRLQTLCMFFPLLLKKRAAGTKVPCPMPLEKNTPTWAGEADRLPKPLGHPSGPGKSRSGRYLVRGVIVAASASRFVMWPGGRSCSVEFVERDLPDISQGDYAVSGLGLAIGIGEAAGRGAVPPPIGLPAKESTTNGAG
jgi:hypothetical protein